MLLYRLVKILDIDVTEWLSVVAVEVITKDSGFSGMQLLAKKHREAIVAHLEGAKSLISSRMKGGTQMARTLVNDNPNDWSVSVQFQYSSKARSWCKTSLRLCFIIIIENLLQYLFAQSHMPTFSDPEVKSLFLIQPF